MPHQSHAFSSLPILARHIVKRNYGYLAICSCGNVKSTTSLLWSLQFCDSSVATELSWKSYLLLLVHFLPRWWSTNRISGRHGWLAIHRRRRQFLPAARLGKTLAFRKCWVERRLDFWTSSDSDFVTDKTSDNLVLAEMHWLCPKCPGSRDTLGGTEKASRTATLWAPQSEAIAASGWVWSLCTRFIACDHWPAEYALERARCRRNLQAAGAIYQDICRKLRSDRLTKI